LEFLELFLLFVLELFLLPLEFLELFLLFVLKLFLLQLFQRRGKFRGREFRRRRCRTKLVKARCNRSGPHPPAP